MEYAVRIKKGFFGKWMEVGLRSYSRGSANARAADYRALGFRTRVVMR